MAQNTQIVSKERLQNLGSMLKKFESNIAAVLPKHMTAERMVRIVYAAASRNPLLLECTPLSIVSSVITASQLGLEPVGPLGHAYLVPYFNNKTGNQEAQLIIGYQGMIELSNRSGKIKNIRARPVYEKDDFKIYYGLREDIQHTPVFDEPGQLIGVYAVAEFGGDLIPRFEFMPRPAIEAIRKRSKAGSSGPWVTDYEQMALKTVIKRLCKTLPKSIELATAIAIDNATESGDNIFDVIDADISDSLKKALPEEVVEQPALNSSKADRMADRLGAPEQQAGSGDEGQGAAKPATELERLRSEINDLLGGGGFDLTEPEQAEWLEKNFGESNLSKLKKDKLSEAIMQAKEELRARDAGIFEGQ